MKMNSLYFIATLLLFSAIQQPSTAFHDRSSDPDKRWDTFFKSLAEQGSSKWGNYISTSSSPLTLSQIQQQTNSQLDQQVPTENFTKEILAFVLGGAVLVQHAAVLAFGGTFIITIGSIFTVMSDNNTNNLSLMDGNDATVEYSGEQVVDGADCDFNGHENIELHDMMLEKKLSSEKLNKDLSQLNELRKCYIYGSPESDKQLNFARHGYKDAICIADEDTEHYTTLSEEELDDADYLNIEKHSAVEDNIPRVEVVWHDNGGDKAIQHFNTDTKNDHRKQSKPPNEQWATLTEADRDGALLLSQSFKAASSTLGIVADGVRFVGETSAATVGGVARLAGGTVRLSAYAVGNLGEALENSGNDSEESEKSTRKLKRQAASNVKLIGDALEQVGDSLLLVGSATERVAFATSGVAEGSIRILQDFTSSMSDMFSKESRRENKMAIPSRNDKLDEETVIVDVLSTSETIDRLVVEEDNSEALEESTEIATQSDVSFDKELVEILHSMSTWIIQNYNIINTDTAGVPSIAVEMLGVFLFCFLASIYILSPSKTKKPTLRPNPLVNEERPRSIIFHNNRTNNAEVAPLHNDNDDHSSITNGSTMKNAPSGLDDEQVDPLLSPSLVKRLLHVIYLCTVMPLKLIRFILITIWNIIFNKKTLLLVFHLCGWLFLSRVSQYKASVIQRKSELLGYQMAIQSIGKSSPPTIESAVWLNTILFKLWRIQSGGLEPILSAAASSSLDEALKQPYTRPSAVAHVSLESFTFGSSPPAISRIEIKGVVENVVLLEVDVGLLMNDASLILEIKPSQLEYRSLPSTRMSINSLDATATLNLAVKCSQEYPYISVLSVSLVEIPDYNLKIEPQSDSGLKGIDLGSFPVVSRWIKSSINSALSSYLTPQHISIDVLAWLREDDRIVTYFEG